MYTPDVALPAEQVNARAQEIFADRQLDIWKTTDRLFAYLLLVEWVGAIIEALVLSPLAWTGTVSETHPHVWLAVVLGGAIIVFPVVMAFLQPGKVITRHSVALGQMLMSALLIHLSGGRIETHFHVFASLAFLAFYRDWKIFLTASTIVALDHALRGLFWPQSVYGVSFVQPLRWMEHSAWVIFENIFLIVLTQQSVQEMRKNALREATNVAVEQMRDQALEATNLKSAFVANISHELRTPLNAVLGMNELLMNTQLTAEQHQLAEMAQTSARALSIIVNDLLDLSKIEANKMTLEFVDFNPISLVHDCTQLLMATVMKKDLILKYDIEARIPACLRGDSLRVHQVLLNLLGNAVKFTDGGTITVRATIEAEDEKQVQIKFAVSDTGIGLSESERQYLFLPFTQVDGSTTRRYGGSGLGLAICKRLVTLMRGEIGVVSTKGQGSTFWFTVPFERREVPVQSNVPVSGKNLSSMAEDDWVLVVEDSPVLQLLERKQLESLGFHVRAVASGLGALEELPRCKYKLILMDCQLPDLDGFEVTRRIRSQETSSGEHVAILAVTAGAMAGDREQCLLAGMDEYLSKPYTVEELKRKIYQLLSNDAVNLAAAKE